MIPVNKLIALFQRMYEEHWSYILGSAKQGCVDCSGAFVYAYKVLGGGRIDHGSNSIFRQSIDLTRCGDVPHPGYAAFKVRSWKPDESSNRWYDTAPGDVYHIGLVNADCTGVLNAKGSAYGFCLDKLKGWTFFAPLKAVNYGMDGGNDQIDREDDQIMLYKAIVTTESDDLRVRQNIPSGKVIGHLPKGAEVDVLAEYDGWDRVKYDDLVGYASAAYLTRVESADETPPKEDDLTDNHVGEMPTTTLVSASGQSIMLVGEWRVAND